jgi:hypothetical protein
MADREKKPVDFDELYPGRFVKAGIIGDKRPTLTIAAVDVERLAGSDGKEATKGVVSFVGKDMQLVLNRTNGTCLREMFGRRVQEWVGKRVTLFRSQWQGEDCIRIWGSPDIAADMAISIELPRRKPILMTMHKTGQTAPQQREPGEEG